MSVYRGSGIRARNNAGRTRPCEFPVGKQMLKIKLGVVSPLGLANRIETFSTLRSCILKKIKKTSASTANNITKLSGPYCLLTLLID